MPAIASSHRRAHVAVLAAVLALLWAIGVATRADAASRHRAARATAGKVKGRTHAPAPLRNGRLRGRAPLTGTLAPGGTGPTTGSSLPGLFGVLADQVATTPPPATADGAPAPAPAPATLGVSVSETPAYRATLSRGSVLAGAVRIQLQNEGEDDHDLRITRTDDGTVAGYLDPTTPGRTRSATVTLSPGTYRLACTLQAPVVHADAGMRATLTVTS